MPKTALSSGDAFSAPSFGRRRSSSFSFWEVGNGTQQVDGDTLVSSSLNEGLEVTLARHDQRVFGNPAGAIKENDPLKRVAEKIRFRLGQVTGQKSR